MISKLQEKIIQNEICKINVINFSNKEIRRQNKNVLNGQTNLFYLTLSGRMATFVDAYAIALKQFKPQRVNTEYNHTN